MSAEEKFLGQLKLTALADALNPLVISDMDSPGSERDGLGWSELFDPQRVVPMMARLPDVVRQGDHISLFWTTTKPSTQPPEADPVEAAIQFYELDQDTIDRGWLSFAATRDLMNLPADADIPYPFFGYFYYSLFDPSAGDTRYSEYREVLIDLRVPGGLDPRPETPVNEYLVAPIVSPSRIDTYDTPVTVTLDAWDNMQPDDQVTLVWNGVRHVGPRLVEGDVGKRWVINLPADVIREGGSGENLLVYYELRDRVQNYSRPSPPAYVTVEDPNTLEAPEVEGAEDPPYRLDLDELNGQDVTIYLPDYDGYVRGDTVTMHWIGLTAEADGKQVPYDWAPRVINVTRDKIFDLPYEYAALVVNGSANVYYEAQPSGGAPRPSRRRSISIVGRSLTLLPPVLVEAVDDVIDLATLTEEVVHVRIPLYPGQRAQDVVTLFWTGNVGEGGGMTWQTDLEVPAGGENTELVFEVSLPYLEPLVNGTLTLSYSVFTPQFDLKRASGEVIYDVVDTNAVEYPAPICAEVQGSGADAFLPSDTATAIVEVPNNAPLRIGDVVTLRWAAASGNTPPAHEQIKPFDQFPFTFAVANADILPFDGLDMSVTYSVGR
ncbi:MULTISPECIES: hypothetical protein [unclassified Pseudomonas]|uniref:hypothetical protein n=1 Tax=unclassified Pseudomonas TaxID=196821 RepID=UPI00244971EF|nr:MULTISPECIES: hypothetical protein [unclassified Pseudomonas]MDH0302804.1 hypothetical protein [Pseudomonas sp. GD04091]MDH1984383.1 hypothetical protein [Pseudomonas sp. GD03689]